MSRLVEAENEIVVADDELRLEVPDDELGLAVAEMHRVDLMKSCISALFMSTLYCVWLHKAYTGPT